MSVSFSLKKLVQVGHYVERNIRWHTPENPKIKTEHNLILLRFKLLSWMTVE